MDRNFIDRNWLSHSCAELSLVPRRNLDIPWSLLRGNHSLWERMPALPASFHTVIVHNSSLTSWTYCKHKLIPVFWKQEVLFHNMPIKIFPYKSISTKISKKKLSYCTYLWGIEKHNCPHRPIAIEFLLNLLNHQRQMSLLLLPIRSQ